VGLFDRCLPGCNRRVGIGWFSFALGIINPVQSRPKLGDMHLPNLGATGAKCRVGKGDGRKSGFALNVLTAWRSSVVCTAFTGGTGAVRGSSGYVLEKLGVSH